jgi:hypothetical protein
MRLALATSSGLVALGFALLFVGWTQTSTRRDVATQLPFVVSASMVGVALVGIGAGLVAALVLRGVDRDRFAVIARIVTSLEDSP